MENEKKIKVYTALLISVLCLIGVSYAWFRLYLSQSENNKVASRSCFDTTLTEDNFKIDLTEAIPESDENGLKETPFTFSLKNNCTGYVRAYITIDSEYRTSTSTSYLKDNKIKVNISPTGTTLNPSSLLTDKELIELEGSRLGYSIIDIGLNSNEEKTFDLRVWMDSSTTVDEGLNKTWEGKIVVLTEAQKIKAPDNWNSAKEGTLLASIRDNNILSEPLTVPGRETTEYTVNDIIYTTSANVSSSYQAYYITYGTGWEANETGFNLTGTAVTSDTYANSYDSLVGKYLASNLIYKVGSSKAETLTSTTNLSSIYYIVSATPSSFTYKELNTNKGITERVLASTEDDYGTSYYFRGAVENNYVEYANMCWRIVRVTGNGAIKLVLYNYNGLNKGNSTPTSSTPCNVTGEEYAYARIYYSTGDRYNFSQDDAAFVGLMHGNIGCSDGSSSASNYCTSAGGTWTASTSYTEAHVNIIASTMLKNLNAWYTQVLSKQEKFDDKQLADTIWCNDKSTASLGYGQNGGWYAPLDRLYYTSTATPSLICPNDNNGGKLSKFTVNDTKYGNGALNGYAKIGLLTADEAVFAGSISKKSSPAYYLVKNTNRGFWWTLSPAYNAHILYISSNGGFDNSYVTALTGNMRPALSLISTTKISSGDGTATNPYKIAV